MLYRERVLLAHSAHKARASFVAPVAETLAEPGVGYARLRAPDGVTVWEVLLLLLPLRDNFGNIERLIGCLHPVSGRTPEADGIPLRFTIDEMSIRPVDAVTDETQGDAMPLAGFGEGPASFEGAPGSGFTAIEGGLDGADRPVDSHPGGTRPKLRVVKTDD